jgi:NADPH:quinone reductase-like Zn-dependent oxidoreductase
VHACSVNPIDWKIRSGAFKLLSGIKPPRILGSDYAGVVIAVGKQVTTQKVGDAVWGFVEALQRGTYAEFVKVKPEEIGPKPTNLSFEEAAAVPLAGLTALQALVYKGRLKKGDHVMVNGCSGGVGLAALQIARALECQVTGVCSTRNLDVARKMGAHTVIDYTTQDVLAAAGAYDMFFDVVSNKTFFQVKETLKPGGIYVPSLPSFQSILLVPFINIIGAKKIRIIDCKPSRRDLAVLKDMVENWQLVPLIEKVYPLDEVGAAHIRSESGRVVGKLVLKVI